MSTSDGRSAEAEETLAALRRSAAQGGGLARLEKLRAAGRGTARQRLATLLDEDSFVELDAFVTHRNDEFNMHLHHHHGDGVVVGQGRIDGRRVYTFAQDFSVYGGSMGEMHARKLAKLVEMAERARVPLVGIWDGGGLRAHDGVAALAGAGELLDRLVACSGRIPVVSVVLGPLVGVSALGAALADVTILGSDHGAMFLSSPLETEEVTSGEFSVTELGGAEMHASRSGIADFIALDEDEAMEMVGDVLSYLPDHALAEPPHIEPSDTPDRDCSGLQEIVPDNPNRPYDIVKVIEEVVDEDSFLELAAAYADNIVVGFARLDGGPVGIIANQPKVLAGCLDIDASVKAARFIRLCDCYGLPVVTFVDVPGFLPGTVQEWGGIIRHGAKLLYAYAEASVPKLTVIPRKAYGGAYLAMACKHLQADLNVAWPTGELAVMGAEGAVNIIHRREIAAADDQEAVRTELIDEYRRKFGDPYVAARHGWLDDVIEPETTRIRLISALKPLRSKREWRPPRKHGNIPL